LDVLNYEVSTHKLCLVYIGWLCTGLGNWHSFGVNVIVSHLGLWLVFRVNARVLVSISIMHRAGNYD